MSAVVTAIPRAAVTPRSIDKWAKIIADDLTRAVARIIDAGQHLQEAKAEVDHGDWLPLLKGLKIGERTAQMLMTIAENEALANPNHWFALPTSWRTLSELATLSPEFVKAKIAEGVITPEITRDEVSVLRFRRSISSVEELRRVAGTGDTPPQRPKRRKRIPNMLITSWEDMDTFLEIVRHNLQVEPPATPTPKTLTTTGPSARRSCSHVPRLRNSTDTPRSIPA